MPKKNKITAALLAFFIGWSGAHWFYLGKKRWGILVLLLSTLVPLLLFAGGATVGVIFWGNALKHGVKGLKGAGVSVLPLVALVGFAGLFFLFSGLSFLVNQLGSALWLLAQSAARFDARFNLEAEAAPVPEAPAPAAETAEEPAPNAPKRSSFGCAYIAAALVGVFIFLLAAGGIGFYLVLRSRHAEAPPAPEAPAEAAPAPEAPAVKPKPKPTPVVTPAPTPVPAPSRSWFSRILRRDKAEEAPLPPSAAIAKLEAERKEHPRDPELLESLAAAYAAEGRLLEAIPLMEAALKSVPGDLRRERILAGYVAERERETAKAEKAALARAARGGGLLPVALAEEDARPEALPSSPKIRALEAQLLEHPRDLELLEKLAALYDAIGRPQDAARLMERCLVIRPGFAHYESLLKGYVYKRERQKD